MVATKPKSKLSPKQELFCTLYAEPGEFFGNGTQAYIEAYSVDLTKQGAYQVARSGGYENLTKPHLLARIRELLELGPLNPETVDRELAFTIYQSADMASKMAAIREYNALNARITKKLNISGQLELKPLEVDSTVASRYTDATSQPADNSEE